MARKQTTQQLTGSFKDARVKLKCGPLRSMTVLRLEHYFNHMLTFYFFQNFVCCEHKNGLIFGPFTCCYY